MEKLASLYEHLRKIKTDKTDAISLRPEPFPLSGIVLSGFEKIGEYTFYSKILEPSPFQGRDSGRPLCSSGVALSDTVFFDTETTGLSGGAGNLVFLIGIASIVGEKLSIEQYFLADFPGEKEFLSLIDKKLSPGATYVSFNGKAFDSHLLTARFALHGSEKIFHRQYDLLHPARRLWKHRLANCSLKNVEREILGIERGDDIDGFEVPERYFRFLRTGDPRQLEAVFYHNHFDVFSLAKLLVTIESLLVEPAKSLHADPAALAAMLFSKDILKARELLLYELGCGNQQCGRMLGLHHKRNREFDQARAVWETMFAAEQDLFAGIELAKHFEHREKDPARALAIVDTLLTHCRLSGGEKQAVIRRRERLIKKSVKIATETR